MTAKLPPDENVALVPPGTYHCKIVETRLGQTTIGDERWHIRLDVVSGEHAGKVAAWDRIVWSTRGRARARLNCHIILGKKAKDIWIDDLLGKEVMVRLNTVSFETPQGNTITRNEVYLDGYSPVSVPF